MGPDTQTQQHLQKDSGYLMTKWGKSLVSEFDSAVYTLIKQFHLFPSPQKSDKSTIFTLITLSLHRLVCAPIFTKSLMYLFWKGLLTNFYVLEYYKKIMG